MKRVTRKAERRNDGYTILAILARGKVLHKVQAACCMDHLLTWLQEIEVYFIL